MRELLLRSRLRDMRPGLRLFLLSFLMLFVELALIRWAGSNVVYLSYFSNFVLLGSFLGIGIGFLRASAPRNSFMWAPVALFLLVAFVRLFPVEIDRSAEDVIYFGGVFAKGLPLWVVLPVIFVVVAAVLAMIAEGVAREFARFEPLEAYRLDVLGAIAGIVAFTILSFAGLPPVAWGLIVGLLFFGLFAPISIVQAVATIGLVAFLAVESAASDSTWSPYYKITLERLGESGAYDIHVNGIPHQTTKSTQERIQSEPFYLLPYERTPQLVRDEVLIVGAGTGSDVAIALSEGAQHIDAVEIDPKLHELGVQIHPDRPYQSAAVDVTVTDGRAFLEQTDKRYDLILFALPDSLTLVSGQSSLRLESYLFTREAMAEAREHLKPGGAFAMYNYYRQEWLVGRLARTLADVYGTPPCVDISPEAGQLAVMTIAPDPSVIDCPSDSVAPAGPVPVTDDYPFLYLRERGLPAFYGTALALLVIASMAAVRLFGGRLVRAVAYADLFFMGAAFLLLESKSVIQFALLFGTTWIVNALVFTGILLAVLAAVEVARKVRFRQPVVLYVLLLAALAIAWSVPTSWLLGLSVVPRFVVAIAIAFSPIFLANLIFADRFRDVASSTTAFGVNLLGAMIGGVLEYASLIIGYRGLLILTAMLYTLALITGRRSLLAGGETAHASA